MDKDMKPSDRRSFSGLVMAVVAVAVTVLVVLLAFSRDRADHAAEKLYLTASGQRRGTTATERVRAARALARRNDADAYLVLLLLSSRIQPSEDEDWEVFHASRLGIVAVTIKALPDEVSNSVLYAMTLLLDEDQEGRWSERRGLVFGARGGGYTGPIRELVRDTLKDRIGEDHGYDALAWQRAITNR